MKICVIGAMSEEVAHLKTQLSSVSEHKIAQQNFVTGKFGNHDVTILQCGIGKVNAAVGTTLMLKLYQPDYVINTGVAGGLDASLKIGEVVISKEVCYHDVDVTAFGYELGQMARMPTRYQADDYLVKCAEECAAKIAKYTVISGLIVSGDSFVHDQEQVNLIKKNFATAFATDMEACAIAQTCYLFGTPFVVIRAISDVMGDDKNTVDFKQFLTPAAQQSAELVIAVIKKIGGDALASVEEKVLPESASLDHTKVVAPYLRLAGIVDVSNADKLYKYDVRFTQPNVEYVPTAVLHALEHLLAVTMRQYLTGIVDISPMGCLTGFYIVAIDQPYEKLLYGLEKALRDILLCTEIPFANKLQCGAAENHDLAGAKKYAQMMLDGRKNWELGGKTQMNLTGNVELH